MRNRVLLAPGKGPLTTVDDYTRAGGYAALRKALADPQGPQAVLDEISVAQMRGRGGAGVLTAEKLKLVARAAGDKYLICNAYDADDKSLIASTLLEQNPHQIIEGMALAGLATGATEGYLYMRASRTAAEAAVKKALAEALERGLLGRRIAGSRTEFSITLVGVERGFMGGEESTMIEIISGRPMKAQQRPPYPTENGLNERPTVVLNAETLANFAAIVAQSGQAFAATGTRTSPGTKLFTVYGPGLSEGKVVEVPMGAPLQQALKAAGLDVNESTARAVVIGGKEGGVVPLSMLTIALDYDSLDAAGVIMGSSILEALPQNTCMVRWAMDQTTYLAGESCGKCIPCRTGVKRVAGTLEGITSSLGASSDLDLLTEFSKYIPDGSLCGFGVHAVTPTVSAMKYFADDFSTHLAGKCPTNTCAPVRAHRYALKHVL
ncbi:MAG TPA: NADH-ubiquinone oxidoreductase-F iron-sulfur binding region domain-containing protein [Ktedonobacterales bacterium]